MIFGPPGQICIGNQQLTTQRLCYYLRVCRASNLTLSCGPGERCRGLHLQPLAHALRTACCSIGRRTGHLVDHQPWALKMNRQSFTV